jgi:integrase
MDAATKGEVVQGDSMTSPSPTCSPVTSNMLAWPTARPGGRSTGRTALSSFFGAGRDARTITPNDFRQFRLWRSKHKTRNVLVSPTTIDREQQFLRAAYNVANQNQVLDPPYNPAAYVKLARVPNRRDRVLTDVEFAAVVVALAPERRKHLEPVYRVFLLAARYLGLRKSALLDLRWSRIDGGIIYPPEFDPSTGLYQSSKRHGVVPIPPALLAELIEQDAEFQKNVGLCQNCAEAHDGTPEAAEKKKET